MRTPLELPDFIWSIADLLRSPYRPPQHERLVLPWMVLRRFDCVLKPTKQALHDCHNASLDWNAIWARALAVLPGMCSKRRTPRARAHRGAFTGIGADLRKAEADVVRLLTEVTAWAAQP